LPRPQAGMPAPGLVARMARRCAALSEMKRSARTEKTQQANEDQVQGDDVIQ
jgi:hypothetical protein